jgi:hypothetical protein
LRYTTLVTEYNTDLLLAAGAPERWLAPGEEIVVQSAPTYFGPISYSLRGGAGEVRGRVELPQRTPFGNAWLTVRAPGARIASVTIDGKRWSDIDPGRSRIRLPKRKTPMEIVVKTR